MPGQDQCFVGIGAPDRSWYLRFFAGWDDRGETLLGKYSLAISLPAARQFEVAAVPKLECNVPREEASPYFERIRA